MPNFSSFGLSTWPGLWVWFEILLHILYLEDFCTRKHDSILNVAKRQIDDFVEEKGSSGGAGEASGDEFAPISQIGVATDAREQPAPTHMVEEYAPHSDG